MRVAAIVLGTGEGSDDVVQDAAVRGQRSMTNFRAGAPFAPWFFQIVANTARNHRRASGRRARLAVREANQRREPPGPEELTISHGDRSLVVAALSRLSPEDRLIIGLRHIEQLHEAEIATVLGCKAGTVKSRLSRAMQRLRAAIEEVQRVDHPMD
jgi:RNA polymerase sigma factor (sigma-70 family)